MRQTDVRQKHRLTPPPCGGGSIISNASEGHVACKNLASAIPEDSSYRDVCVPRLTHSESIISGSFTKAATYM